MAMCIRDMMQGNSKLADIGRVEESLGYNAIAAGFQGQRHWTDQYPNGDTAEAILNSSLEIFPPICNLPHDGLAARHQAVGL